MNKPIKKILVILLLLVFLPLGYMFYSQFSSMDEYEENIRSTYLSQLETILFSINQYSEDLLRSWINQTELSLKDAKKIFEENSSLLAIVSVDSSFMNYKIIRGDSNYLDKVKSLFQSNKKVFLRLKNYQKLDYQKLESFDIDDNKKMIAFVNSYKGFSGFIIDKEKFANEKLIPKINSIATRKFSIVIFDSTNNSMLGNINLTNKIEFKKKLWLFPELKLGIVLNGKSISEIVNEKRNSGLIILTLLLFFLLLLSFAGYNNFKKEFELLKMKSDFVANVSHELRTPLSLISLYSETLLMGRINSEEKAKEYYKIIQQESERLSQLINKILNFSKIENDKIQYQFVKRNLNDIVSEICDSYCLHLKQSGFNLIVEISEEKLFGLFDENTIKEALINIIDNAIKYSVKTKEIKIKTGNRRDKIFVSVEDKGIGISKQNQKKIFDKFFRVAEGNIHNVKGTGIGLTIVKHIVDAHKGEIEIVSSEKMGSKFVLLFPKINEEA